MIAVHKLQQHMDAGTIQVYVVGGYVRDRILGRPGVDHDFVVVGGNVPMMESCGFKQVGADFPVFLSELGDEFALARKERKKGLGYHGFDVDFSESVTLEEDLSRRDITINSMARKVLGFNDQGHAVLCDTVIDPFGGAVDLYNQVIRHTSMAFDEDPVRILRVARFASRYGFDIHPDTINRMKYIVDSGECHYLTAERVWLELTKTLSESTAVASKHMFFSVLDEIGAGDIIFPGRIKTCLGVNISNAETLLGGLMLAGLTPANLLELKAPHHMILFAERWYANHMELLSPYVGPDQLYSIVKAFDLFRPNDYLRPLCDLIEVVGGSGRRAAFANMVTQMQSITATTLLGDDIKTVQPKEIGRLIEQARKKVVENRYR